MRSNHALRTLQTPGHEVELAVSALAGLGGFAGYHTSVLVAGEEYYFCPSGICCSNKIVSHEDRDMVKRIFIGLSQYTGGDLIEFLSEHFRPHSYDLLRKNCNSFTDCALYFLCEQRLDVGFRVMEQLGRVADEHTGLVQRASMGDYCPNRRASKFHSEDVIKSIAAERNLYEDLDAHRREPMAKENILRSRKSAEDGTIAIRFVEVPMAVASAGDKVTSM
jgi:hypothetical protein